MKYLFVGLTLLTLCGCSFSPQESSTIPVESKKPKIETKASPLPQPTPTLSGVTEIVGSGVKTQVLDASGSLVEIVPMTEEQIDQIKNPKP